MADSDRTVTNQPPRYASFDADEEALNSNHNTPMPSGWSLAGPLLFLALVLVFAVLRGVGVLPS